MEQSSSWDEWTVRHQFDRICKLALKGEVIDYQRHMAYRQRHEVLLSELPEKELSKLFTMDKYNLETHRFQVLGYDIEVKDILVGEVYLPLLTVPNETREIGFYGRLHRNYLKDYKSGLYSYLSLSGKLWSYLADVNEQCVEHRDYLMDQMMEQEGITEELKSRDQMEWVRRANNVRSRVDEIILNEMVYV